jgi:hypothetical protein
MERQRRASLSSLSLIGILDLDYIEYSMQVLTHLVLLLSEQVLSNNYYLDIPYEMCVLVHNSF